MNDYKELIDGLQRLEFFNQRAGRELWADKPHDVQERDIESAQNILLSAIEAIEQLVKERGEWMEYAKQERKRSIERSHELTVELDRVKKERDAAVLKEAINEREGEVHYL